VENAHYFQATGDMESTMAKFFSKLTKEAQETKRKLIYAWRKDPKLLADRCHQSGGSDKKTMRPTGLGTVLTAMGGRRFDSCHVQLFLL
jgi:hypothetical protein